MTIKKLGLLKTGAELKITRQQAEALKHLYNWHKIKDRLNLSYLQFRRQLELTQLLQLPKSPRIDTAGFFIA